MTFIPARHADGYVRALTGPHDVPVWNHARQVPLQFTDQLAMEIFGIVPFAMF